MFSNAKTLSEILGLQVSFFFFLAVSMPER